MRKRKTGKWVVGGVVLVVLVAVMVAVINRQWIYDFARGMGYTPLGEMVAIRDRLGLTERGEFLFRAARPSLSTREEFNAKCRSGEDTEIAVLGCYTTDNIYVYNIEAEELDGIRELTTAHELLHAVWARKSTEEKQALGTLLERVLEANHNLLDAELETYAADERREELFVRVGTEVKDLPEELEKTYAEIFENQDAVVEYYEKYIGVFRQLEVEMGMFEAEMTSIKEQIEAKTTEYERRVVQLNADVLSFNSCASVAGCFENENSFSVRRGELVTEQEALTGLYEEINELVDEYNDYVDKYNTDVTRGEQLNRVINSAQQVEGV